MLVQFSLSSFPKGSNLTLRRGPLMLTAYVSRYCASRDRGAVGDYL